MAVTDIDSKLNLIEKFAEEQGAHAAATFPSDAVVLDSRVKMKCEMPICPHFGQCLTCPPNVIPFDEFQIVLEKYSVAMLVQTRSEITGDMGEAKQKEVLKFIASMDFLSPGGDNPDTTGSDLNKMKLAEISLHKLINEVEGKAMELGFHFAAGIIGGRCMLCDNCVGQNSDEPCRVPGQARPSMEGLGIDVAITAQNAGLPFELPPKTEIIWNGLLLVT